MSVTQIVAGGRAYQVAHTIEEVREMIADPASPSGARGAQGTVTFDAAEGQPPATVNPYGSAQVFPGKVTIEVATIEAIS